MAGEVRMVTEEAARRLPTTRMVTMEEVWSRVQGSLDTVQNHIPETRVSWSVLLVETMSQCAR